MEDGIISITTRQYLSHDLPRSLKIKNMSFIRGEFHRYLKIRRERLVAMGDGADKQIAHLFALAQCMTTMPADKYKTLVTGLQALRTPCCGSYRRLGAMVALREERDVNMVLEFLKCVNSRTHNPNLKAVGYLNFLSSDEIAEILALRLTRY